MDNDNKVASIKAIIDNADWLTNWCTSITVAVLFSLAASTVQDKLTFVSIMASMFVSSLLAATLWPIMLVYFSGGLGPTLALAMICGLGGLVLLLMLISVIRKYVREDGKKFVEGILRARGEETDEETH